VYSTLSRQFANNDHISFKVGGSEYAGFGRPKAALDNQSTYSFRGSKTDTDQDLWVPTNSDRFPPRVSQGDKGHEFWTTKTTSRHSHTRWLQRWNNAQGTACSYSGALIPASQAGIYSSQWPIAPAFVKMTSTDIGKFGSIAINATIPTKPSVSTAQFIGELGQLPRVFGRGLLESRANVYRGLGSEYLNVQFGWKPFVADIKAAVLALRTKSEILTQYHRDSGKTVRRRWTYTVNETPTNASFTPWGGPLLSVTTSLRDNRALQRIDVPIHQEDTVLLQYSFSGAYTYHLPLGEGVLGKLRLFEAEANKLLGTSLTPSVLWELAPWSWLIDWNGTIGVALENASLLAGDELVLQYGYLMRETTRQRTLRIADLGVDRWQNPGPITSVYRRTSKERVRANPYGFTLAPTSYSAKQWAILGALGLTKAPRIL